MLRYGALVLVIALSLFARSAANPSAAAQDEVRRATTLVLTTFYRKIEPRDVLVAERAGLTAYAHDRHLRASELPRVAANVSVDGAPDAAVALYDAAVRDGAPADGAEYAALKAIATSAHDRWTAFFTPAEYKAFDEILDPHKLSGIGILLDVDEQTKYVRAFFVVPNTPADRAGMKSGDLLVSIDGNSTKGWSIAETRKHLLGAPGTSVAVSTQRPSDSTNADLQLTREEVTPPSVYFNMLDNKIAYLYVAAFGTDTPKEFHTAVQRCEEQGARAYVLDVRNDGGGIVGTALSIASEFVSSGPLVSIEANGGQIETYDADNDAIPTKPLAVLVNAYSASASEIMAAAISESGTGVLVGTRTFGKGVVQSLSRFPDGSAIKITTGRYYTPQNHDINGRGIVPSVVVTENDKAVFGTPDKDAQLSKALTILGAQLTKPND